jgi:hypothetical protein
MFYEQKLHDPNLFFPISTTINNSHTSKRSMLRHSNIHTVLIQTQTHSQNHPSIKQPVIIIIIIESQLINPIINQCNYHSNHSLIESLNVLPTYAAEAALPTPTALIHPDLIVIALPFCIAIAMAHLNCLLTCDAGTYD